MALNTIYCLNFISRAVQISISMLEVKITHFVLYEVLYPYALSAIRPKGEEEEKKSLMMLSEGPLKVVICQ